MGSVYRELKNYDKAMDYFRSSVKLSIETGNKTIEALNYKELSIEYMSLKD
jgi:tetratricopeptide (TPR) repeat protein